MPELYIILILMIVGAIVAVEAKRLLSSIVVMGTVGLGLSLAFLVLKAPDLAIVQLVVEILALIILIRATVKRDVAPTKLTMGVGTVLASLVFVALFLAFAYYAVRGLPRFGYPTMRVAQHYLDNGLAKTGAANLVASVILDFRAYDTLGEATVLFTAIIGALAVLRRIGRKKPGETVKEED